MLEKKHFEDQIIQISDAVDFLIETLELRELSEDFNAKNTFEKRVLEMINHLLTINKVNLP